MSIKHPFVSETHEGRPAFEWSVAALAVITVVVAALGYEMAATAILAATAIVTGLLRLLLRERSPWKVRSVRFDAVVGIGLGLGLLLLYFSIHLLS